jgi:hypothetical protein
MSESMTTLPKALESMEPKYPILKFFAYEHLPENLQQVSRWFADVAYKMAQAPRNAETSAGLRKLLEAKDCAVRAALGGSW